MACGKNRWFAWKIIPDLCSSMCPGHSEPQHLPILVALFYVRYCNKYATYILG